MKSNILAHILLDFHTFTCFSVFHLSRKNRGYFVLLQNYNYLRMRMGLFRPCQLMDSAFLCQEIGYTYFPAASNVFSFVDEYVCGNLRYFHRSWNGDGQRVISACGEQYDNVICCIQPLPWALGVRRRLSRITIILLLLPLLLPVRICSLILVLFFFFFQDSNYMLCCIFFHFLTDSFHLFSYLFQLCSLTCLQQCLLSLIAFYFCPYKLDAFVFFSHCFT